MKIKVTTNIDKIVGQLNDYKNSLADKKSRFLERLAEEGIALIKANREKIIYDGDRSITVDYVKDGDDKITIYAKSDSITFIEFGSGINQEGTHELAGEFGFVRGEYGMKQGRYGLWIYRGEQGTNGIPVKDKKGQVKEGRYWSEGNPPNRTVYQASRDLRQRVVEIAREVYGE